MVTTRSCDNLSWSVCLVQVYNLHALVVCMSVSLLSCSSSSSIMFCSDHDLSYVPFLLTYIPCLPSCSLTWHELTQPIYPFMMLLIDWNDEKSTCPPIDEKWHFSSLLFFSFWVFLFWLLVLSLFFPSWHVISCHVLLVIKPFTDSYMISILSNLLFSPESVKSYLPTWSRWSSGERLPRRA